jgi:type II secretory pathway pseudopilin PulG
MKFALTGTPAASPSRPRDRRKNCAGFTLFEALVALALVLAFVEVLGPYLFHARRIMANADGRVAAQALLRSLLDAPFDRTQLANVSRTGETAGLRWRIVTQPLTSGATPPSAQPWTAFRVIASVSSGGEGITAETVRLAKSQ